VAWNEPLAASFLGENVPKEHLMYVLEIDPPVDKNDDNSGVTLMPACNVEGNCTFNRVRKESKPLGHQNDELSRSNSLTSVTSLSNKNPDQGMTIIDGSAQIENMIQAKKSSSALRTLLYGRKRSAEKVRNFKSTLTGLRIDTEYVIKISFVLSGRKLGSESYRILCNGGPCRKSSNDSSRKSSTESGISSTDSTPKSSLGTLPGMPAKKDSPMFKQLLQKVESIDTQTSLTEQIMVAKSSDEVKVLLKFTPDDNYAMQKRLIILEFVASWCGLCDQVSPQMEEISENYGNKSLVTEDGLKKEIIFIRADIDDCEESARIFGIEALPSVFLIEQDHNGDKNHEILSTHFGQQVMRIEDEIETWLNHSRENNNNNFISTTFERTRK